MAKRKKAIKLSESPLVGVTLLFIAGLLAVWVLPRIRHHAVVSQSFLFAIAFLLVWFAILAWQSVRRGRVLTVEFVPRAQHYMQAFTQGAVFLYWGWYWRPVYESVPLILGQLLFAYAFDSLLSWSRRDKWVLGFGPFPIIFSINLFLWFKDDWFYLQFVMIGVGFLAKEFIRWKREGRLVHIFNPSAFSLGLFSFILVLLNSSDLTWGPLIAQTQLLPPNIYIYLFVLGLVGMIFFSTTLVAGCAAITLFALSAIYTKVTGVYWFFDSEIPIAVFLGLFLLVTDPSTSPRSLRGKAIFGVLYGVLVFVSYGVLGWLGVPTFYDKLLPVPILNLAVRLIDRWFPLLEKEGWPEGPGWSRQWNLVFVSVWIVVFMSMLSIGAVGDSHPGRFVPFWQRACAENRIEGCRNLVWLENVNCELGSGWACNELGAHLTEGKIVATDTQRGAQDFALACQYGFSAACTNSMLVLAGTPDVTWIHDDPRAEDFSSLLLAGKGPLPPMSDPEINQLACRQGWTKSCYLQ